MLQDLVIQCFRHAQWMQGGDLRNALALAQDQEFSWYSKGRQICLDVLKALVFLHKSKVRSYSSRDPRDPKGSLLNLCHSSAGCTP